MPFGNLRIAAGQKVGHVAMAFGQRGADRIQALGPVLDADHVAQANFVAGDIDAAGR